MDCQICCENANSFVNCRGCNGKHCCECYINLYKTGQGVIVCPFCRYTFGVYTPSANLIDAGVKQIRYKLAGEWDEDVLYGKLLIDTLDYSTKPKGGKKKRRKHGWI